MLYAAYVDETGSGEQARLGHSPLIKLKLLGRGAFVKPRDA